MKAGTLEIELITNVARLQREMADMKRSVAGAMGDIADSASRADKALGSAGGGGITRMGGSAKLASHHMQNLVFQLNDMVVGLFSGQKPLTVFMQQGTQIGQIGMQAGVGIGGMARALVGLAASSAAVALTNPYLLAAAAAAALAFGAFKMFQSSVKQTGELDKYAQSLGLTKKEMEKLGPVGITVGDTMKGLWKTVSDGLSLGSVFSTLKDWAATAFDAIMQVGKYAIAFIYAGWVGGFGAIKILWASLPGVIGEAAVGAANLAISGVEFMANKAIAAINWLVDRVNPLLDRVGLTTISRVESVALPRMENSFAGSTARMAGLIQSEFSVAFGDAMSMMDSFSAKWRENTIAAAKVRLAAKAEEIRGDKADKTAKGPKTTEAEKALKAAQDFARNLELETAKIGKTPIEIKRMEVAMAALRAPTDEARLAILQAGEAWEKATKSQAEKEFIKNTVAPLELQVAMLGKSTKAQELANLEAEKEQIVLERGAAAWERSFAVYPDEQRFHCFGCGAHGDIFDFLQAQERLDIRAAAERLTGGNFPVMSEARVVELRARQARFEAEQAERRKLAADQMRLRWAGADPTYSSHPYLTAKGIRPNGTRLDREHILVPLFDAAGELASLQSIDPAGHKLFEAELPVAGSAFVMGAPIPMAKAPVFVCEGFATGASLHEATGRTVVVTFNAGNLTKVAERLVAAFPKTRWVVAGDDDRHKTPNVGREAAGKAAEVLRCEAVFPVLPEGHLGTDFNDMAQLSGHEAVAALFAASAGPDVFETLSLDELVNMPAPTWLIDGLIPQHGLVLLYGRPGEHKTFIAVDGGLRIAYGLDWHGRAVKRVGVLYIAGEGRFGIGQRIKGWRKKHGLSGVDAPFKLLPVAVHMLDPANVEKLKRTIDQVREEVDFEIGMVVIDTVSRAIPGQDENSQEAMSLFVDACAEIQNHCGGVVIGIHHSGKDADRGMRGSTVLLGGCDTATGFTNAAATVSETTGPAKPQSDIKFDVVTSNVTTIAHWVLATRQILDDVPMLQSYVDGRLRYGLALVEENQLLNGSGTGTDLAGIYTQATAFTPPITIPATVTRIDVLRLAMLQTALSELMSTGVVLHPADWAAIELLKDGQGQFIVGNPQGTITPTLWGQPVVSTQSMATGKFLTGAFQLGAQIFDRMDAVVEISTEDDQNFRKNLVTVLAEERLALAVYRPEAFVKGDFAAAATAATKV